MGWWEGSWKGRGLERREQGRNRKCSGDWEGGGRKDRYGFREEYISTMEVSLGFTRDLIVNGIPGPRRDPQISSEQRRGCLNWPWPITILMNILLITIDPSSGNGWR